jgi:hypothetical protein
MIDLKQLTPAQLLSLSAGIGPELRRREIVRSENITGDVAEYLFCLALGLTPRPEAHIDAVGPDGKRYQIKGRRRRSRSRFPRSCHRRLSCSRLRRCRCLGSILSR